MLLKRIAGAVFTALAITACSDEQPVAPGSLDPTAIAAAKGGNQEANAEARGSLLVQRDVQGTLTGGGSFEGQLTVTEMGYDEAEGTLTIDGVLTWVSDGQLIAKAFEDLPADLTRGTDGVSALAQHRQRGANEAEACDILFLEIPGGVFLDVLGLTVDLAPVALDIDALRGPNRLLGNLLCSVTGLLDGGAGLSGLLNLLDRINDLLDDVLGNIGDLVTDIPVAGALPGGGTFEGLLDLTGFGIEDGQLLISGLLEGTVTQNGVVTQISQTFENLPASLSDILGGIGAAQVVAQSGHEEAGVCDILFLEIPGGVFLDVLGLTVDLAPVELDVDAQSGANALLGNLLCGLTGLLSLLADLPTLIGQISDLIDLINEIMDLADQV